MSVTPIRLAAMIGAFAAIITATPSFAQNGRDHRSPAYQGEENMSAARAAAIHECSERSDKYLQRYWGVREIEIYRACMADHGQME